MIIKTILKALKPFRLVSLVLTYVLGGGLVQYVRGMHSWSSFIQGGIFLFMVVLSIDYLRLLQELTDAQKWPEGIMLKEVKQVRLVIAVITATSITAATTIFTGWMVGGVLWQGLIFLLIALIILGVFYYLSQAVESIQPFQILFEAFLIVVIPPAVAFFLQSENLHRLLTLVVIGLVPAYLGFRLLIQLQHYGRDYKHGIHTIVTQMGWNRAMVLHNALILLTYLLFALTALLGFPWFLLWPVFLTLPIGLLEVGLMERVRRGGKPLWRVMQFATLSVFLIPIYLLAYAFWIR